MVLELAAVLTRLRAASRFDSRILVALFPSFYSLSFSLRVLPTGLIIPLPLRTPVLTVTGFLLPATG